MSSEWSGSRTKPTREVSGKLTLINISWNKSHTRVYGAVEATAYERTCGHSEMEKAHQFHLSK